MGVPSINIKNNFNGKTGVDGLRTKGVENGTILVMRVLGFLCYASHTDSIGNIV